MKNDGKAVKASPAQRLERIERRYQKLTANIYRTQRRFEKADKSAQRALKLLAVLERDRRRMDKRLAQVRAEAADMLVMSDAQWKETLASVKPLTPELRAEALATAEADDGVPQFLKDAAAERARKLQAMPNPLDPAKKATRKAVAKEITAAELTGKRRRMPLQGKDAVKALRRDQ